MGDAQAIRRLPDRETDHVVTLLCLLCKEGLLIMDSWRSVSRLVTIAMT
jgi:hypothetical protein